MAEKQVNVYIKTEQNTIVQKQRVLLSDIATVYSTDKAIEQKLKDLPVLQLRENKKQKITFSVMDILKKMNDACSNLSVTALGEEDFIVEYVPKKKKKVWLEYIKTAFVCFSVFFGGGFAIMTFNKDAQVQDIFGTLYTLVTGSDSGNGILELAYAAGIPLGIILFFDHFSKAKIDSDPTPLQVQLRLYEQDVNQAIIENAGREGKKHDIS